MSKKQTIIYVHKNEYYELVNSKLYDCSKCAFNNCNHCLQGDTGIYNCVTLSLKFNYMFEDINFKKINSIPENSRIIYSLKGLNN